jgi:hypothetical protein
MSANGNKVHKRRLAYLLLASIFFLLRASASSTFLCCSCWCFRMLRAIMRQVKFSMRCWLGSCCLVLAKNFQT